MYKLLYLYRSCFFLLAAFKIIKALLPPKAVASMRFVSPKNIGEYITEDCQLKCWGGKDDYEFSFEPEKVKVNSPPTPPSSSDDEKSSNRKVCFYVKAFIY